MKEKERINCFISFTNDSFYKILSFFVPFLEYKYSNSFLNKVSDFIFFVPAMHEQER